MALDRPLFCGGGGVVNVHSDERGFSLVEVIVVVAIISTMMALAVGVTMNAVKRARADNSTRRADERPRGRPEPGDVAAARFSAGLHRARTRSRCSASKCRAMHHARRRPPISRWARPTSASPAWGYARFVRPHRRDCVRIDSDDSVYQRRLAHRLERRRVERNAVRRDRTT